jgi:hypothetical protein
MSSKDCDQQGEDHRAPWERPAFRRLVTKDAEGAGILQDEGNTKTGGTHSGKQ